MPDFALGATFDVQFNTADAADAPITLAGSPVVKVFFGTNVGNAITSGVTLAVDVGQTGRHNVNIAATGGNGYAGGSTYFVVITTGTVDGVSVVGRVVGTFSIQAESALRPTTPGNTLDVTATGAAGIDWGNVENQGTTVTLTFTTVAIVSTVTNRVTANADQWAGTTILTPDIAGLPMVDLRAVGGLVGIAIAGTLSTTQATSDASGFADDSFTGRYLIFWTSSIGSNQYQSRVVTGYVGATGRFTWDAALPSAVQAGDTFILIPCATGLAVGDRTGNLSGSVGSVTGNVGGNVVGSVGSVVGNVGGTTGDQTVLLQIKAKTDLLPEGYQQGVGFDLVFYMGDTSTNAPVTGLTDGDFSVKDIIQDIGAPAAITGTIVELGDGYYTVPLTNAEANAVQLSFNFLATGTRTTAFTLKASP